MLFAGVSCTYGAQTGVDLGAFTEGNTGSEAPPNIEIGATLNKAEGSFLCPSDIVWAAVYSVTTPENTTLSVAAS